jgi:CBS domain-containing protein
MSSTATLGERPIWELMTPVPPSMTVDEVQRRARDARSEPCLVVGPEMPLLAVAQTMAERKADCCAVVDGGRVAGVVTANDLLHVLAGALLLGAERHTASLRPSHVRARILAEHDVLRQLYANVEELALGVLSAEPAAQEPLRERCRELYQTLLRHMELENTILAPALRETTGFGPVRAQQLLDEHERQRVTLFQALIAVETHSEIDLAREVRALIGELLEDMAHEEHALLHPDLLSDDPITADAATG